MTGIPFSQLPAAETLSEDDLIALSQPDDGGGFESKRARLKDVVGLIPPPEKPAMMLVNPVEGDASVPESGYDGTIFIGHGTAHQGLPIIDDGDNRSGSIAIGMGAAADVVATVVGRNARGTGNHGVAVGTEASSTTVKA
ncbi:hypothetical protein EKN38_21335, partial [Enterobacter sp. WCHEn045836]|uniref:hypothetical protein n=1 Tax=Enterobacter sp. WCHEn045836 TaxID=2497434 RepID=UPI000FB9EBFE